MPGLAPGIFIFGSVFWSASNLQAELRQKTGVISGL
jgi:hypothetical protein